MFNSEMIKSCDSHTDTVFLMICDWQHDKVKSKKITPSQCGKICQKALTGTIFKQLPRAEIKKFQCPSESQMICQKVVTGTFFEQPPHGQFRPKSIKFCAHLSTENDGCPL